MPHVHFEKKSNVECPCRLLMPCRMSNLENNHVSLHYHFESHVTSHQAPSHISNLRNGREVLSNFGVNGHSFAGMGQVSPIRRGVILVFSTSIIQLTY